LNADGAVVRLLVAKELKYSASLKPSLTADQYNIDFIGCVRYIKTTTVAANG
jgi:hypothetical protein